MPARRRAPDGKTVLGEDEHVTFYFDGDCVAFFVAAFEERDRQRITDLALDHPPQGARPEIGVVTVVP